MLLVCLFTLDWPMPWLIEPLPPPLPPFMTATLLPEFVLLCLLFWFPELIVLPPDEMLLVCEFALDWPMPWLIEPLPPPLPPPLLDCYIITGILLLCLLFWFPELLVLPPDEMLLLCLFTLDWPMPWLIELPLLLSCFALFVIVMVSALFVIVMVSALFIVMVAALFVIVMVAALFVIVMVIVIATTA